MSISQRIFAGLAFSLALSAHAENYECTSPAATFAASLFFDDGPGGLDYVRINYLGKKFESGDIKDFDDLHGVYEYVGEEIALGLAIKDDPHRFYLNARKDKKGGGAKLNGTLLITLDDRFKKFSLTCELI
jgi:hypothetical protein